MEGLSNKPREEKILTLIGVLSRGNLGEVSLLKQYVTENEELLRELKIREVKTRMRQVLYDYKDSKIG